MRLIQYLSFHPIVCSLTKLDGSQVSDRCPLGYLFNFSDSFFFEQLSLEDQNRFISIAKDSETRTPSTGTKNNKFVSGLKFSSINVNGIRSEKLELLADLDFIQPQIVEIQETKIDSSISTSELFLGNLSIQCIQKG